MSFCDSVAKVTLIAGAIGLLVGYWNYAKPTLHGEVLPAREFQRSTILST